MNRVVLTSSEILQAALVGVMRQTANIRDGRSNAHGLPDGRDWQVHIEGALGECAFAKFMGLFWSGALGQLKADDVGLWQVRTNARTNGDLIIHERDANDRKFALVRGTAPHYDVVGWIFGKDGKRQEFWKDPTRKGRPAFFVPETALNTKF